MAMHGSSKQGPRMAVLLAALGAALGSLAGLGAMG
jgi:hypothetical protein